MPLRLTTIVTGILLSIMPFLTGCGGGGETGSEPIISTTPGEMQASQHLSHGAQFNIPQSLPMSSITAGTHQVNRVAAHMKVPYTLPPRQSRSQTLTLIPSTTLRSVPITV